LKDNFRNYFKHLIKNKPKWLNVQNVVFIIVIVAFIVIVIWSESLSIYFQGESGDPNALIATPTTLFGTPTPLPEEYLTSAQQTNGIVFGALIILIAIMAGTAAILIRDRDK
jgi:hypothetical protein